MIVEFFGMPGSGKTTIYNSWINQLLKDQRKKIIRGTFDHLNSFQRVVFKVGYSFRLLLVAPDLYLYHLFYLKSSKTSYKNFLRDLLNITYLLSRYQKYMNTDKIVIFDQGLVQAIWSIQCFNKVENVYNIGRLDRFIQNVLILNLNIEDNQKRLKQRSSNKSRVKYQDVESLDFYFREFSEIKKTIIKNKRITTIDVDASLSIKESVLTISEKTNIY